MSHSAFLLVMSQLSGKKNARVMIQGNLVFFEALGNNRFKISTKVYSGDGFLSNSVHDCVSSRGMLHWQHHGAHLKLDSNTHSIYLIEEIEMEEGKYIPFRNHLSDFSMIAVEWKEILREFSERDTTSVSI